MNPETSKSLLKKIGIAGLILGVILSWGLVLYILLGEGNSGRRENTAGRDASGAQRSGFRRELDSYDAFDAPKRVLEGENPNEIERRLSRLQRQVQGVEEQLSVLKRRRELALIDRRYIDGYSKLAREAAEKYAYSAPLAAVAAEAVLLDGVMPVSAQDEALLREYASKLSQYRFSLLELSVHILAGNLSNPALAAAVPGLENLISQNLEQFLLPEQARPGNIRPDIIIRPDDAIRPDASIRPDDAIRRDLLTDEFLLRAVKGDISGATARLNTLLSAAPSGGLQTAGLMGAEFYYDHNNPHRAAELFSRLAGDTNHAMTADALVLAGEMQGARNIWFALASGGNSAGPASGTIVRSLYNMASSSGTPAEEASWLERLFTLQSQLSDAGLRTYGIIRYARLDRARGIAILEESGMRNDPLLDLELLRLTIDTLPPRRAIAEVWMLLGRHPEDEELYEWAAWYFDHQRLYDESSRVLKEAARKGMVGVWLDLHRSLALIREGKIADGEKILREAMFREAGRRDWRIPANLGRIQEGRRAISTALEYYEAAATLVKDKVSLGDMVSGGERPNAARLQMRISRCLEALGRHAESRRAIEYALELDPDNIFIRRELRLLGNSR